MQDRPTILVADDEQANRSLIRAYLSTQYHVVEAVDGAGALSALSALERDGGVDLVLLDVRMPGLNGLDVCREIKSRSRDEFLPVVMLTALTSQEDRRAGLVAGADDFLTKPVDSIELKLRCEALIARRRQDTTIRTQLDELRRLQKLKDDLFTLIVHDIRNPLQGVEGFLQIAREGLAAAPQVRDDIDRAYRSARRIRELVDSVLEVRMLEHGSMALKRETFLVAEIISEAVGSLEGAAGASGIPLHARVRGPFTIVADRRLARRAIENLIANAVKYTRRGTDVEITAEMRDGRVAIDVADRGPGVPEEFKQLIFEKFSTVEGSRGMERRGFGLGLHLVRLVAQTHGGSTSVRDREGGGAVFTIAFPVAPVP